MASTQDTALAQHVLNVTKAIQDGRFHVRLEDADVVAELMTAPRGMLGSVDTSKLSSAAKSFVRVTGMGLSYFASIGGGAGQIPAPVHALSVAESQVELFRLFDVMFTALTGTGVVSIRDIEEIRQRMMARFKDQQDVFARQVNAAGEALEEFYKINSRMLFGLAKSLGGVKLITGGQRMFGPSAQSGVRITGLYADTQLIPDPIYPYFSGELHLNAMHLQMAHTLFYILPLKPLVDAGLPTPPLFVFPSFEVEFEAGDAVTMQGISDLAVRLVAPVCDGTITSLEELNEYAVNHEARFVDAVMADRLFVPPGSSPTERMTGDEAVKRYLSELQGIRDEKLLAQLRKLPSGILVLNGIIERLRPQFHLYENSAELDAQPLLSQEVHWHYYEKCAEATAQSLVKKNVLSEQSYQTLRALQDDSLGWLASIPIEGLVELNRNQEHKWFRKELKEYTTQLTSAGAADLSQVVREVNHALGDLVQRQQKALRDIEDKYAPKKVATYVGGALTVAAGAAAVMMPFLAPALGLTVPAIATAAGVVGTAIGYGKEKAGEVVEKNRVGKTMLGVLAITRPKGSPR